MKHSPRLHLLQTMDRFSSWLPSHLLTRNDAGAALSPFLEGLRYLRNLPASWKSPVTSPQEMRRKFRADMQALRVGFPLRTIQETIIPGAAGELKARHYHPDGNDVLPVLLVYFHGGGFIMGDLDTHDDACRLLCQQSGMPLLAVDYRLAPEHPFPSAVNDSLHAVQWAQDNAARLGVKAIAVGGDSAGGNLAAVTAQAMAAAGKPLLAQLLIYPGTDRSTARPSHRLFGKGFFLSEEDRDLFYSHYLAGQEFLGADPRVSPLLGSPDARTAPALIVTAGFDMLRDEGDAYALHLRSAGLTAEQLYFDQLGHGFINLAGVHGESRQALTGIAARWRNLCQQTCK